jgi:hypothetical protein
MVPFQAGKNAAVYQCEDNAVGTYEQLTYFRGSKPNGSRQGR